MTEINDPEIEMLAQTPAAGNGDIPVLRAAAAAPIIAAPHPAGAAMDLPCPIAAGAAA
ncbi:MAG: hypothetical protein KGM91_02965 [Burkholderiales bacterium]|nr:hypothetical protein [Burkholderiales bacterium]